MEQFNKKYNKKIDKGKYTGNLIRSPDLSDDIFSITEIHSLGKSNYSGLKMIGIVVLMLTLFIGISSLGSTVSYFNDTETSTENKLQSGSLGFDLNAINNFLGATTESLNTGTTVDTEDNISNKQFNIIVMESDGSLPPTYTVSGLLDPGNPSGCDKLNIVAILGDYNYYSGQFNLLASNEITEMGEWQFLVTLPVDNPALEPNALCRGEIIFKAGLAGVAEKLTHTYSDEKKYPFELKNWNISGGGNTSAPDSQILPSIVQANEEPLAETSKVIVLQEGLNNTDIAPVQTEETPPKLTTTEETTAEIAVEPIIDSSVSSTEEQTPQ